MTTTPKYTIEMPEMGHTAQLFLDTTTIDADALDAVHRFLGEDALVHCMRTSDRGTAFFDHHRVRPGTPAIVGVGYFVGGRQIVELGQTWDGLVDHMDAYVTVQCVSLYDSLFPARIHPSRFDWVAESERYAAQAVDA